jgi:hypothetical protein
MRPGRGRVLEGLRPVRNTIWVTKEGESHRRGVSMAAGSRPVRMWERGRSVGRGDRQSDQGGALHWLDARGRVGRAEERPKFSNVGEHMMAHAGDGEVLLWCTGVVESCHAPKFQILECD